MNKFFKIARKKFKESYFGISMLTMYGIVNLMVFLFFYHFIPEILNYPPGTINTDFQVAIDGLTYAQEYTWVVFIGGIFGLSLMCFALHELNRLNNKSNLSKYDLENIRKNCINIPYTGYLCQIIIPTFILFLMLVSIKAPVILTIKISILTFSLLSFVAVITLMFLNKIFSKILLNIKGVDKINGFRINMQSKIIIFVLPLFLSSIFITALIGYSKIINEKGEVYFNLYKTQLEQIYNNSDFKDINDFKSKIKLVYDKDEVFTIDSNNKVVGADVSSTFIKYLTEITPKYKGRVYDYNEDIQGAILNVKTNNEDYIVGVKYEVSSNDTIFMFLGSFAILVFANTLVLAYFSKNVSEDISVVAKGLHDISNGENKLKHKLPITANDEIGELETAFNEFEEAEQTDHERLVEQERLSSLGQLVGGIAHNLKSPILSISGAMEGMNDLVSEYEDSLGNDTVTEEDFREISKDMKSWIEKVRDYTSYMNDVITTVKDQAVSSNDGRMMSFTIDEIIKRIDIITKHTLSKNHCTLNKDIKVDPNTSLTGDITVLIQVLNNMIVNSVEAYNGEKGIVDLIITKEKMSESKEKTISFTIADQAGGIKPEIAEKLFKQMYTTKGKNGTGLGLYISHTTIKGKFGGDIVMNTEYGKGTSFNILIPEKMRGSETNI